MNKKYKGPSDYKILNRCTFEHVTMDYWFSGAMSCCWLWEREILSSLPHEVTFTTKAKMEASLFSKLLQKTFNWKNDKSVNNKNDKKVKTHIILLCLQSYQESFIAMSTVIIFQVFLCANQTGYWILNHNCTKLLHRTKTLV